MTTISNQKIATNLTHGKRAFGNRNPWYCSLQNVVSDIHIYKWMSHDGADEDVLYSLWRNGKDLSPRDLKPTEKKAIEDAGYAHIF